MRKIENPDNLGPYWRELGYRHIGNGVFKRETQSGPAPIVVCAEKFHAVRKENLRRVLVLKEIDAQLGP